MISNQLNSQTKPVSRHIGIAAAIIAATTLLSSPSFALGTAAQRAACTSDVMRHCMGSIGSDSAIIACMKKKRSQFSARCNATLPRV